MLDEFARRNYPRIQSNGVVSVISGEVTGTLSHLWHRGLQRLNAPKGCNRQDYRTPDGRLWFPTTKGLAVVNRMK